MTDFRALCAELLDWAEVTAAHYIQLPAVMLRARAALAEPKPEGSTDEELLSPPVPVNERLPSPEDCDEEGRCWWWQPSHPEGDYLEGWMPRPRFWGVGHYDLDDRLTHTHWLPAHAIPIPTAND